MNPGLRALHCLRCGATHAPVPRAYDCPACRGMDADEPGILDAIWDYPVLADRFRRDVAAGGDALARFGALLPAPPDDITPVHPSPLLDAPTLARDLGCETLRLKYEGANPARCLKDRATALATGLAQAAGADTVYCASAGNAAISLATFATRAGLACEVFVPSTLSVERVTLLRGLGAEVHLVDGPYDAAFDLAEQVAGPRGWYSRNCALNPWLVEGKKTVAFEIAEQLGWRSPDWVVAPVGDGCTLAALGKGFRELVAVGLLDRVPRLLGVQAAAVAPLVRRMNRPMPAPAEAATRAASIHVERPRNARRLLAELAACGGDLVAVSDGETAAAQETLRRAVGDGVEFTSATTLAGARRAGALAGSVVLVVTSGREE